MTNLNLAALRGANKARLPQFKNNKGEAAHSQPDGSDWTPNEWLIAMMGEIGEVVEQVQGFPQRMPGMRDKAIGKELADVQIYLDITAQRVLDEPLQRKRLPQNRLYTDEVLMDLMLHLGRLCELYKKHIRGDRSFDDYERDMLQVYLDMHKSMSAYLDSRVLKAGTKKVDRGIDLAEVTILKFNETSVKVGSDVVLGNDSWIDKEGMHKSERQALYDTQNVQIDKAAGLELLLPIRLKKEVYDDLEMAAQMAGGNHQSYVRGLILQHLLQLKGSPNYTMKLIPRLDSPNATAPTVNTNDNGYTLTQVNKPPMGVVLRCQFYGVNGWTHLIHTATGGWYNPDTHIRYTEPDEWMLVPESTSS